MTFKVGDKVRLKGDTDPKRYGIIKDMVYISKGYLSVLWPWSGGAILKFGNATAVSAIELVPPPPFDINTVKLGDLVQVKYLPSGKVFCRDVDENMLRGIQYFNYKVLQHWTLDHDGDYMLQYPPVNDPFAKAYANSYEYAERPTQGF